MDVGDVVGVAGALIRLRRETLVGLEARTGIRAANLSSWLKGKPQVISAKRAARLLDELGVRAGALRTDVVHQWASPPHLPDVVAVLTWLAGEADRGGGGTPVVYCGEDADVGPETAAWLRVPGAAGNAYVHLLIEASIGARPACSIAERIGGIERTVPFSPNHAQSDQVIVVQQRLAAVDTEVAAELGHALERAESKVAQVLDRAKDMAGETLRPTTGWQRLQNALVDAVLAGRDPDQIACVVEAHVKSGRNE